MSFATQNLWAHVAVVTAKPVNEMGALGYCFDLHLSRIQNIMDYESPLHCPDWLVETIFFCFWRS